MRIIRFSRILTFPAAFLLFAVLSAPLFTAVPAATAQENATAPAANIEDVDVHALVEAAHEHWRGTSSRAVMDMTIHRPDWERTMTFSSWTMGREDSIIFVTSPSKDKGNGTLKKGREMWTFNPKVNRVIKIPPSMMAQAWMGSDFSNEDLAKSDSVIDDYDHKLVALETNDNKTVYVIDSIPKPDAPVVWGKLQIKVREDFVYLSEEFFDEDMVSVKIMTGEDIKELGGRTMPARWTMRKTDKQDEYTLLVYKELEFDLDVQERMFSLEALKRGIR